MKMGIDSVVDLAHEMGFSNEIPKGPAIALGAVDGSLYDMVKVYGTFANRGVRPEPYYLTRIETSDGDTLVEFENPKPYKRALPVAESDMMVEMMQSVVDSGTAKRLRYIYGLYNDIAGKTGTTQSHADGWFVGYTPNLVAGVWVGAESPRVHFRSLRLGQGANTALPIWGLFMQKLYKDPEFKKLKKATFPDPSIEVLEQLDSLPYLEEMPETDSLDLLDGFNAEIERLFDSMFKNRRDKNVNVKPDESARRQTESERKAQKKSEEIQKNNEKLKKKKERKKKRQDFWDKLRKKKN
jgi:penicillin-binding protein 1A